MEEQTRAKGPNGGERLAGCTARISTGFYAFVGIAAVAGVVAYVLTRVL